MKIKKIILLALAFLLNLSIGVGNDTAGDWTFTPDSIATVSHCKADEVLQIFDSFKGNKVIYSLNNKYYFVVIYDRKKNKYNEFVASADANGKLNGVDEITCIEGNRIIYGEPRNAKHRKKALERFFREKKFSSNYITWAMLSGIFFCQTSYHYLSVIDKDKNRILEYCVPTNSISDAYKQINPFLFLSDLKN